MKSILSICFAFLTNGFLFGQTLGADEVEYLNRQIYLINQSIHRMVIIHRVFENYNAKTAKHVDLPTNEGILNTAAHLPENLFADNDLVRTGDSPLKIYDDLLADPRRHLFSETTMTLNLEVKRVIDVLNRDRNTLDAIISQKDLDQFSNIQEIYTAIEDALGAFDRMRRIVEMFEQSHQEEYYQLDLAAERRQVYTAITELHYDIKKLTRQIRDDDKSDMRIGIDKIEKELGWLNACIRRLSSAEEQSDLQSAITSIEKMVTAFQDYIDGRVPEEYQDYGGGYYYHNYTLLALMNQYGTGYIDKLKKVFEKFDWEVLHFVEEPHFMKIIYPERIPIEVMTSPDIDPLTSIRALELRPPAAPLPQIDDLVVTTVQKPDEDDGALSSVAVPQTFDIVESLTIGASGDTINIQLYDHLKKDGDRVSIFVNGEWIHKSISLETSWTTITLGITPGQSNTILIRAENTGWQPPNTFAIRYGDGQMIRRDLQIHQTIKLIVTSR